jgi:alpha-L-arabinofuranosidase
LGEAVFMMGMENNGDVVSMASYAPIFVNVHDRHWMPDMIRFDAARSWGSPSYYVQGLMAKNVGTHTVKATLTQTKQEKPDRFRVGLGSWNTAVEYKGLKVTTPEGKTLYEQVPPFSSRWPSVDVKEWDITAGTWDSDALDRDGIIRQTAIQEHCVAICPTEMQARDYDVTVQARKTGGDEGFLLVFDHTGKQNYRWFNVAGWGNSQHAVEDIFNGGKTQPASARGQIETNRWYTLKVEVRNDHIATFIDGEKVHDFTVETPDILYANAEVDGKSGELIVKVVNFGENDAPVSLSLAEGSRYDWNRARLTLLKGNALDENTREEPEKVVPQTVPFVQTADGSYLAPAHSLSIIRVK